jgi:methionine-rich copper-binding protein CopC
MKKVVGMFLSRRAAIVAALCFTAYTPLQAATPPAKLLVSSDPVRDSAVKEPVTAITMEFAEPVELLGLTVYGAPEGVIEAFEKDYASDAKVEPQKRFSIALPAPLSAPGTYKFSYLVTSKSVASLNGFVDFTIEGAYPEPILLTSNPVDGEALSAPLGNVSMELDTEVLLLSLDVTRVDGDGDEISVTNVATLVDGLTPETQTAVGKSFTYPLDPALTPPGSYSVNYALIAKRADGTETAHIGIINFTVE